MWFSSVTGFYTVDGKPELYTCTTVTVCVLLCSAYYAHRVSSECRMSALHLYEPTPPHGGITRLVYGLAGFMGSVGQITYK